MPSGADLTFLFSARLRTKMSNRLRRASKLRWTSGRSNIDQKHHHCRSPNCAVIMRQKLQSWKNAASCVTTQFQTDMAQCTKFYVLYDSRPGGRTSRTRKIICSLYKFLGRLVLEPTSRTGHLVLEISDNVNVNSLHLLTFHIS